MTAFWSDRRVLVTGGAGYVGHVLVPRLLGEGYNVTVYDKLFFGCRLPNSPNLRVIQGDVRDVAKVTEALEGQDAVLHLACISNDARKRPQLENYHNGWALLRIPI